MSRFRNALIAAVATAIAATALPNANAGERVVKAPAPQVTVASDGKLATAIFAGGCFWGVEAVFSHVRGVKRVVSGYAGPDGRTVDYDSVSSGRTGFAEAVRVTYDPDQLSYGTLMQVFFSVIADPTTLNHQGPDHGTQYRSALIPLTPAQDKAARAYIAQLGKSRLWADPIVTSVERYSGFQDAEAYHQDFMRRNPRHGYIVAWDQPKVDALKTMYPALWSDQPAA